MRFAKPLASIMTGLLATLLTACGGGGGYAQPDARQSSLTVTVSGLTAPGLVLKAGPDDNLAIPRNGTFTFKEPVPADGRYAITVAAQPSGQVCSIAGGSGSGSGVSGSIPPIAVSCKARTYPIAVAVTGLGAGGQVTLLNNGADPLVVDADGRFTFATPVAYNGGYAVTVGTQPTGQVCSVSRGVGAGVTKPVSNIAVTCSTTTYTLSGTVSGLGAGLQLTLQNNGGETQVVAANGRFSFATPVAYAGSYAVTVAQQPTGQTCSVANASGSNVTANISNVAVSCSIDGFTIGGTVSGLDPGQQVTLFNNGGDALVVAANGSFTFPTPVAAGGSYAVKVATQPTAQTCIASRSSGSAVAADVTSVSLACSASADALALLKLTQFQLADAQWDVGACTTTTTCNIFANTPGTAYVTPFTNGTFDWAGCGAGCYLSFTPNIVGGVRDATNPWSEDLYRADGTVFQAGGTGDFAILGTDADDNFYLFYVGSDGNTGTLVTANSILSGAGFSFTGTSQPTITEVNQALAGL